MRKLVLLVLGLTCLNAHADDDGWPDWEARLSGYVTQFGSDLRLDSEINGRGTSLDLENQLDLEDDLSEFRADLTWRFLARHRVDFSYYDLSRDGRRMQDRILHIGDRTFALGSDLRTTLDFEVYKLSYAWSFVQTDGWDVAASIGAHAMDIGLSVTGEVLGTLAVERESSAQVFPLPVLGLHGSRRLTDSLIANFDIQYFGLEVDQISGSFVDAEASLDWYFSDHVAASLGYNYVSLNVESDNDRFLGRVEYRYSAAIAGIKFTF